MARDLEFGDWLALHAVLMRPRVPWYRRWLRKVFGGDE